MEHFELPLLQLSIQRSYDIYPVWLVQIIEESCIATAIVTVLHLLSNTATQGRVKPTVDTVSQ